MNIRTHFSLLFFVLLIGVVHASGPADVGFGNRLPVSSNQLTLWWCSSGWKVGQAQSAPTIESPSIVIRTARNEAEAAQLVLRAGQDIDALAVHAGDLHGPDGAILSSAHIDVLRVGYVEVTQPTDQAGSAGFWPDPLPPLKEAINLSANVNQPLWVRVKAPKGLSAGIYRGHVRLAAEALDVEVPLQVEVYDFTLPDRMQCTTAFGFSPHNVFRYQGLQTEQDQRVVLEKYWDNFAAHHISPYDPAPLDPVQVTWPDVTPPPGPWADWEAVRVVTNEKFRGKGALLLHDDQVEKNITVAYKPLIDIPEAGVQLSFHYRVAVPGHKFLVTLNHFDEAGNWLSGRNIDMPISGDGTWQHFDRVITDFPAGAKSFKLHLRPTLWAEDGHHLGLAWIDDLSLLNLSTKGACLTGGTFEPVPPRTEPVLPADLLQVSFDFSQWDAAMKRALDDRGFNSFSLALPGLGGGTFHAISQPSLLGFTEKDPEYEILLNSYLQQMQAHLEERGWVEEAFVYWFDEPSENQYAFVTNGFSKLKRHAPNIRRMITEQVEDGLVGGPDIWCPVSYLYHADRTTERRAAGEEFWWYVCTEPKAPYAGLFIDHPGTELRVWLWQTWKHGIDGILVWQTNYWTSGAAYPDHPQNPYEDPMGWTSGYSTPAGVRKPWGNGDGRFIYPPETAANADSEHPVLDGPVDSIRWEMLRDGIEDYEYFAILKRLLDERGDEIATDQRIAFEALLKVPTSVSESMTSFTTDPAPMEAHRDQLARAITALQRK